MSEHGTDIVAVIGSVALVAGVAGCQSARRAETGPGPAIIEIEPALDPRVVSRLQVEFPTGTPRAAVRARAAELGMSRRPTATTLWMEGGLPGERRVEESFLDIFEIGGAIAASGRGADGRLVGMVFSEEDRLECIVFDTGPAAPREWLKYGPFGVAGGTR